MALSVIVVSCSTAASAATIVGRVLDENEGHPPAALVVAVSATDWMTLSTTQTDNGFFTLNVADGSDLFLIAISFSGENLDGYALHGYTLGLERVVVGFGLINRDIRVRKCHELILEGRHSDGSVIRLDALPPGSAAVDDDGNGVVDGLVEIDGVGELSGVPSLCVPVGEAWRLYLRYELPGAGLLNLPFDRDGEPFVATGQGAEVLDFNETLARSQLARLDRIADEIIGSGVEVPAEFLPGALWTRLDAAATLSPDERAPWLDTVSADAVVTLENLILWKADRDAELVRTGQLDVVIHDLDGSPLEGIAVEFRQLDHDFGFGIYEPAGDVDSEIYDLLDQAGLNSVTAGYFWKEIESAPGVIDWNYIDDHTGVLDLVAEGWRVKGHPLTWFSEFTMPAYLDGKGFLEIKQISVDHVAEIIEHYRGTVSLWDVSNEASGIAGSGGLSREQMDEYLAAVFSAARTADPTGELVLNNHFDPFGHARIDERSAGSDDYFTLSVPAFVRRCIDRGVDFDIIGQQLYNGGAVKFFADLGLGPVDAVSTYDLGFISEYLDELAGSGRPIHITEHSVPSAWDETSEEVAAGYWRQRWNEEVQATYLDSFMRLAFAHPSVYSITWWNALDRNALIAHGGLVRPDGSPKPALGALADLIARWTSSGVATTDASGEAVIRGFAGDYELTVTRGFVVHRFKVHITERSVDTITLSIDPFANPPARRPAGRRSP